MNSKNEYYENQIRPNIPDGYKFLVWLSHDVDRTKKHWFHYTNDLVFHKKFSAVSGFLRKNNPYWNFDKILNLEEKYGAKSTFFFLNESIKFNPFKPKTFYLAKGRYKFSDKRIKNVIAEIDNAGWEVGLHGSYNSYRKKSLLKAEKNEIEEIIGKKIKGIRQHHLNLDIPYTWEIQKEIGFEYDASFGLKNDIGFRNNLFYPFSPISDFRVYPLTVMEVFLLIDDKDPYKKIDNLIELCIKKKTIFSVLWHQRFFNRYEYPVLFDLYEYLLKCCVERKGFFITHGE